ncbi:MAG: hypothetical protein P1V13_16605 [Rhizobiaceae bacterium]|nr:hypothetical protein [Rhizobiaceae bacterium]
MSTLILSVSRALIAAILLTLFSQAAFSTQYQYIKPRPDKVVLVFIPGIFGSKLFDAQSAKWHWGEDDYGGNGLSLLTYPTFTPSLMEKAKIKFKGFQVTERNIYSDFERHNRLLGVKVSSFAYDWRRSNRISAAEFDKWLCSKDSQIEDGTHIVFVAHSMGGLVLRHWLNDYLEAGTGCARVASERIDQIVFAGTPHLGSLEPVGSLFTGESSLTNEPFFSLLFSDNIVRDALTFESTYELLPSYNLVRPDCSASESRLSNKLVVHSDTGTSIELQLWNIQHWEMLKLPAKLPKGMAREVAMELIELRLDDAAKSVCSLLMQRHSLGLLAKMVFLAGSKSGSDGKKKVRDTVSEISIQAGDRPRIERGGMRLGLGDGTVPDWSSYPFWHLGNRDFQSVSAYHDSLLSDADAKLVIQHILEFSAVSAAISAKDMFFIKPTDLKSLEGALSEFAEINPANFDRAIYNLAASQFQEVAGAAGIEGGVLYDLANKYNGDNRAALRAIGFSVAALDSDTLSADRQFWARQNSAVAFYQLGAPQFALNFALQAGEKNIANFGGDEAGKISIPQKFYVQDSKWRSVVARSSEQLGLDDVARTFDLGAIATRAEFQLKKAPISPL